VLLSRLFAPVRRAVEVACGVDDAAKVDVLADVAPRGDVRCQQAQLSRAVKDGPNGPSAASRAAASLTARNSGATREIGDSGRFGSESGPWRELACLLLDADVSWSVAASNRSRGPVACSEILGLSA
jgi:hypothetical protein